MAQLVGIVLVITAAGHAEMLMNAPHPSSRWVNDWDLLDLLWKAESRRSSAEVQVKRIGSHAQQLYALIHELIPLAEKEHVNEAVARLDAVHQQIIQAEQALSYCVDQVKHLVQQFQMPAQVQHLPAWTYKASASGNLRLHLGGIGVPGFLNVDLGHLSSLQRWKDRASGRISPGIRLDFGNHGLKFIQQNACSHIYCSHVLEHLKYPAEARFVLREIFRVLRPRGRLRLIVPDAIVWLREGGALDQNPSPWNSSFWTAVKQQYAFWPVWNEPSNYTPMHIALKMLGAGGSTYDDNRASHHMGYDFLTLKLELQRAGFVGVKRYSFNETGDKVLGDLDRLGTEPQKGWVQLTGSQAYFSVFVECVKPAASV